MDHGTGAGFPSQVVAAQNQHLWSDAQWNALHARLNQHQFHQQRPKLLRMQRALLVPCLKEDLSRTVRVLGSNRFNAVSGTRASGILAPESIRINTEAPSGLPAFCYGLIRSFA